jgi:hypothetical protein
MTNLLVVGIFAVMSSAASSLPLSGFCSAYTEEGTWDISWGDQDPRFHQILITHQLSADGESIADMISGFYDPYDMNRVQVSCMDEDDSFVIDGFGSMVIERAYFRARRMEASHCLFEVDPHSD